MTSHVDQRLNERVAPATAELAYELLRDAKGLATQLQQWFQEHKRTPTERVALPLSAQPDAPHLVVSRDGHGVTCLAAGMALDMPVLPHAQVQSWVDAQRQRLRVAMALRREDALEEEEGWSLTHAMLHAYRLNRRSFERVRLLAPLLVPFVDQVTHMATDDFAHYLRGSVRDAQYSQAEAERTWRVITAAAMGLMAVAFERDIGWAAVSAFTMMEPITSQRGLWVLCNRPEELFKFTDMTRKLDPILTSRVLMSLVKAVEVRFPAYRAEAKERLEWLTATEAEHPDRQGNRTHVQDEAEAREQVDLNLCMELPLIAAVTMPKGLVNTQDLQALTFGVMTAAFNGEGTGLERLTKAHPALGQMWQTLDPYRHWGTLPSPHLQPVDDLSPEEVQRLHLWRLLTLGRKEGIRHENVGIQFLVSMAPQEALVPGKEPLSNWRLCEGAAWVKENLPQQIRAGQPNRTVRRDPNQPNARPNDPCPCGSGKKFKKCCWGKTQA